MRVLISFLLLLTTTTAVVRAVVPWKPAARYHVVATMSLPYASIVEPIEAWYDGTQQKQRMEYYGDMDTYIFRADIGTTWQINPTSAIASTCFETKSTVDTPLTLQSLFPLLDQFEYVGNTSVNNINVQQYQFKQQVLQRQNVYDIYIDTTNNVPVRYHMLGYDSLLGSHFDEYVLDYLNYTTDSYDDTVFDHPQLPCGGFPGPGFMISNPLLAIGSAFPSSHHIIHPEMLTTEYRTFMDVYGKTYDSVHEMIYRQQIYTANQRWIDATNRMVMKNGGKGATMKMNNMGDLTQHEMNRRRGIPITPRVRPVSNGATAIHDISGQTIPTSIDWRTKGAVNKVKDQGICGSCWSFATVGTLEGSYFIKTGQLIELSEQELMDCSWNYGNNACDGGEDFRGYQWIIGSSGLADSSYGPYLMADGYCHALNDTINSPVQLSGYVNVTSGSEQALLDAIATRGPISISIDASQQSLSFYSSGVYYEPACKNDVAHLDHSVLAVGYGTDETTGETYWIVRNSWSDMWGDQGYVKMARRDNNCGVMTAPTYGLLM